MLSKSAFDCKPAHRCDAVGVEHQGLDILFQSQMFAVLLNQRFLLQLPSVQPIAGEIVQKRRYSQKQYALLANEIRARRNQH